MADFSRYVSLKTVVSMFLDQQNMSMGEYDKAWIIAFRALEKLQYQVSAEPKSVRLTVQGNKTVILPPDYIGWTKIGILNNLGEVSTLKVNNGLSILKDNNPNRLSYLTPDVTTTFNLIFGVPFFLNYFDNGLYYNLFGVGGGMITYGDCRVDEKNNVIILNEDFQYSSIVLEYMSAPQKDGDYQIQTCFQEAIIAFLEWKFKLGTPERFYAEVIEARRTLPGKKATLQNINQVIREATGFYLRS